MISPLPVALVTRLYCLTELHCCIGHQTGVGTPPKDCTKPRRTKQSPKTLYKAPTDYTKPSKDYTKPEKVDKTQKIRQNPKILEKNQKH